MQIIDFKINPSALEVDNFDLIDMQIGHRTDTKFNYFFDKSEYNQKKIHKHSVDEILLDVEVQYRITATNFEKYFGIDILKYVKNYKFDHRIRRKLDSALKEINSSIIKDTSIVIYVRYNNISYDIENNKCSEMANLTNYLTDAYVRVDTLYEENAELIDDILTELVNDLEIWKPLIENFKNKLRDDSLISLVIEEKANNNEFLQFFKSL